MHEVEALRPQLLALAYQMTGDYQEAKDIVQDSYQTWISQPRQVENVKAYLKKMIINRSIDRLKALKKQREVYKGVWLPVPLLTEWEDPSSAHSVDMLSLAMLHLLEKLNPLERAVLLLKESFACSYQEIAELCGTSATHCRQLLHRAKEKLPLPTIRYKADRQKYHQLLEAFLVACQEENPDKLVRLLKEDIALYADGGGKMPAVLKPLNGKAQVVGFLLKVTPTAKDFSLRWIQVNSVPGIAFFNSRTNQVDSVMTLEVEAGQITALYFMRNPDKLFLQTLVTKA